MLCVPAVCLHRDTGLSRCEPPTEQPSPSPALFFSASAAAPVWVQRCPGLASSFPLGRLCDFSTSAKSRHSVTGMLRVPALLTADPGLKFPVLSRNHPFVCSGDGEMSFQGRGGLQTLSARGTKPPPAVLVLQARGTSGRGLMSFRAPCSPRLPVARTRQEMRSG